MARIPLNGQAYEGMSVDVNFQRTVNWYPESDATGKDNVPLYPTPGLDAALATVGNGPVRAMIVLDEDLYVVSSDEFYKVTAGGTVALIGSLISASGRCEMAHNGDDIIVVDGAQGCMYRKSTTTWYPDLNSTAANFPKLATTVTFLDGYFVVNDPANTNAAGVPGAFFISGIYDGLSWAALDYDVAERNWDQIESVNVANGQLWLVGEESSEVWWNNGNEDFPFERIPSAIIEYGTTEGGTVIQSDNSLLFLSKSTRGSNQILQTQGNGMPRKVSTPALDSKLHGYSTVGALSFIFQWKGHTFCVFTFPTSDKTWVYDLSSGLWFQWSTDGDDNRHLSESYVFFNNTHYIGSSTTGDIYPLSDTVYDDAGTVITRVRQSPHLHFQGKVGYISALELLMEEAVATAAVPNPQVVLQHSKDRGHNWNSEQWSSMGKVGEYDLPIIYRRIGRCQDIIFRITVTDAVKSVLIGAYMDISIGDIDITS